MHKLIPRLDTLARTDNFENPPKDATQYRFFLGDTEVEVSFLEKSVVIADPVRERRKETAMSFRVNRHYFGQPHFVRTIDHPMLALPHTHPADAYFISPHNPGHVFGFSTEDGYHNVKYRNIQFVRYTLTDVSMPKVGPE